MTESPVYQSVLTPPPEPATSWPLSARARLAEQVAQIVLGDDVRTARLRRIVREAAKCTRADYAQISIVSVRQIAVVTETSDQDERVRALPIRQGVTAPFEDTICALADTAIAIADTNRDERVSSVPAVVDGHVGSYLGAPIRTAAGEVLGVLCVYNTEPARWTDDDKAVLDRLADAVAADLADITGPATGRRA